jgi:putative membrane protein
MRACDARAARRNSIIAVALSVGLWPTAAASAHPIEAAITPATASTAWTLEPGVLLATCGLAVVYAIAVWRCAGHANNATRREVVAFALGWITIVVALVSPIDAIGSALFSAHMVQHELLMIVAAPLIVAGTPMRLVASAAEMMRGWAPRAGRTIAALLAAASSAVVAWLLHAAAIVTWHVPALFDAAVRNDAVHGAQHLSFFGTAVLFWWGILRGRTGRGTALVAVFTTAVYTSALGALLTVAPRSWYSAYTMTSTSAWGLTPLEDQQLGGLIMWVPASIIYTGVALWLFASWLKESERHATVVASLGRPSRARLLLILLATGALAVTGAACGKSDTYKMAAAMTGGDPDRGAEALSTYGCVTCHTIPGLREARGLVGPPLTRIASRVYLAGRLPNTPDNIEKWIQHPRSVDEKTAMPDTGVTDADVRDIAAYLYTLR